MKGEEWRGEGWYLGVGVVEGRQVVGVEVRDKLIIQRTFRVDHHRTYGSEISVFVRFGLKFHEKLH